ncbi:unnamed protein product [Leptidea sinapis]|uniref:Uncharacterized protein n=1 Tax=Leptidea sinapis TaxID=189913 RepID=A0A5E4Q296_9NEOP|nr:unnamed protein product [Leptidea sinapis]
MAICLRTCSFKILPLNGIVTTKNHSSRFSWKIPVRSHFSDDFLNKRRISSCRPAQRCTAENRHDVDVREVALLNLQNENLKITYLDGDKGTNVISNNKYECDEICIKSLALTSDDYVEQSPPYSFKFLPPIHMNDIDFTKYNNVSIEPTCLSDYERDAIANCQHSAAPSLVSSNSNPNDNEGRPSEEQLMKVFHVLSTNMPELFYKTLDYSIYHPNLVFAPIAAKLALLIGLLPRNYLSDVTPYFTTSSDTEDITPIPFKTLE